MPPSAATICSAAPGTVAVDARAHDRQRHRDRQHAGAAHQGDQQRPAARELLGRHADHRRPEVALADAEDRRRGEGDDRARARLEAAEPVQTEAGEDRADEQRADRVLVRDAAAERAQQEHQPGGVDEEEHALQLRHELRP